MSAHYFLAVGSVCNSSLQCLGFLFIFSHCSTMPFCFYLLAVLLCTLIKRMLFRCSCETAGFSIKYFLKQYVTHRYSTPYKRFCLSDSLNTRLPLHSAKCRAIFLPEEELSLPLVTDILNRLLRTCQRHKDVSFWNWMTEIVTLPCYNGNCFEISQFFRLMFVYHILF